MKLGDEYAFSAAVHRVDQFPDCLQWSADNCSTPRRLKAPTLVRSASRTTDRLLMFGLLATATSGSRTTVDENSRGIDRGSLLVAWRV
jgi:hypothetical protein